MSSSHEPVPPSDLARWAGPVLRRWPLLAVAVALGGGVGYWLFSLQPRTFESSTRVLVTKRAAVADRRMGGEDHVATMTHIVTSDEVLGAAGVLLRSRQAAAPLAEPLPPDEPASIDQLKRSLQAIPSRDGGLAGGGSVLTVKYVAGHPDDTQLVLEAILESVQWYLNARGSASRQLQLQELERAAAALLANRTELNAAWVRRKGELAAVTTEELAAVRARVSGQRQMAFTLQLEQANLDRELTAIAEVGTDKAARQAKLRQLLGVTRLPADAGEAGTPEESLTELTARRTDLAARLVPGHPKLALLDAQIQFYKGLPARAVPGKEAEDELTRYEAVLQERRRANSSQADGVTAQVTKEEANLRVAIHIQDEVDLLRRQLDETGMEANRLTDRRAALLAGQASDYEIRELDRPRAGRQVGPRLSRYLAPALFGGLLLAAAVAHLLEFTHRGFRTPAEIKSVLGVNVLGHVPTLPPAVEDASLCHMTLVAARPQSLHAEHYRGVRANLFAALADTGHKVIQITSPNPGDGKSTTAANLAASLARTGRRVLLVDCDFRKPDVCRLFGRAEPAGGLAGILHGTATMEEAVLPSGLASLWLMPAGAIDDAAVADLLSGAVFAAVVEILKKRFDFVLLDSPPLFLVSDALVLARKADAVLLVFRPSRQCRPAVERAAEQLATAGATVLGVVVNGGVDPTAGRGAADTYKRTARPADPNVTFT